MTTATESAWIDVTVPMRDGMVSWPDDPPVKISHAASLDRGDPATVSKLDLSAHTGTHVDAPVHFIAGASGVDEIEIDRLIGRARVLEIDASESVGPEALRAHEPRPGERILLKTRNSSHCWRRGSFYDDYVYLSLEGARYLVDRRILTIGIDYLSIGGGGRGEEIHRALLSERLCIIEGLDLSQIEPGDYELLCLPLRIAGGDGAPARVLLRPLPAA